MKQNPWMGGKRTLMLVFLLAAAAGCSKMTPEIKPVVPAITADKTTATAGKSTHFHCKPGTALATSGEFDFIVDTGNLFLADILSDHGFGTYNYSELTFNPDNYYYMVTECNLTTYIYHFKRYIDAEIRDLHGNLLLEFRKSKWQVFRNAIGKFNYDDNGLEVYDKEGRIAFNMNFVDGGSQFTFFNGIIPCTSTRLGYFSYSSSVFSTNMPYGTPKLNHEFDSLYRARPIKPIFRYTGRDWQHSRL